VWSGAFVPSERDSAKAIQGDRAMKPKDNLGGSLTTKGVTIIANDPRHGDGRRYRIESVSEVPFMANAKEPMYDVLVDDLLERPDGVYRLDVPNRPFGGVVASLQRRTKDGGKVRFTVRKGVVFAVKGGGQK